MVQVGGADVLGKWYFNASFASVTRCEELRQQPDVDAGKTTKHLDFSVRSFPALEWRTADNLEVLPRNPDHIVQWFAERLGVGGQLDHGVSFVRAAGVERAVKKLFPTPCTVQDALGSFCDLVRMPSQAAVWKFASFVRDPDEQHALRRLLEDKETFRWLSGEKIRVSFQDFLSLFMSSIEMDFGTFVQLCPRQKSRPYTIASSLREDKDTISVCVSAVREELPSLGDVIEGLASRGHAVPGARERLGHGTARRFAGLCSTTLCTQTSVGDRLWILARASSFRLPRKVTTPVVMISAGTGIAPFRAFVREFRAEKGIRPKTLLFFGCTRHDSDFLYREELQEALGLEPPALGELVTAFSRERAEKVYVQHRLNERAGDVAGLINGGAFVYVCGATAMGAAIREELAKTLGSSDYVSRLQAEGRLVEELW